MTTRVRRCSVHILAMSPISATWKHCSQLLVLEYGVLFQCLLLCAVMKCESLCQCYVSLCAGTMFPTFVPGFFIWVMSLGFHFLQSHKFLAWYFIMSSVPFTEFDYLHLWREMLFMQSWLCMLEICDGKGLLSLILLIFSLCGYRFADGYVSYQAMSFPFNSYNEAMNSNTWDIDSQPIEDFIPRSAPPISFHSSAPWTADEDKDLCYIYCHFSNDSAKGNDQSSEIFWGKVMAAYNKKHVSKTRSISALTGRFGKINRQTQFFESQVHKIRTANPSGMGGEAELKRMANDQFLKLFPRENGIKKPHYYQFANCYDVLVSNPKWSSCNAKSLRDVQSKGKEKKKTNRNSYTSSPGDSSQHDSNEGAEENPQIDEDARPMGQHAAKRKNAVQTQLDSRLAKMYEKHAKENEDRLRNSSEKLEILKQLTEIERGRFELEREHQETMVMEKDVTGMDPLSRQYWMDYKQRIVDSRAGSRRM